MTHGHHGHNRKSSRNLTKRTSFVQRYGFDRAEWVKKKKEWRANGEGFKIAEAMRRAYRLFIR